MRDYLFRGGQFRLVQACVIGLALAVVMSAQQGPATSEATPKPQFEVASIKPSRAGDNRMMIQNGAGGRLIANNVPLTLLMRLAYQVQDFQITGAPGWASSERYNIEAKPESSANLANSDLMKLSESQREAFMDQQRLRLQGLLEDRFQLKLHRETKELPVYALVIAKNGPKLQETTAPPAPMEPLGPQGPPKGPRPFKGQGLRMGRGELQGNAVRLKFLADTLSMQLGRTVIDKTGLNGLYDFTLKWTPDEAQGQILKGPGEAGEGPGGPPPPDVSGPSIFTAIQEQLGLKLESTRGPVEVLVIDHVERPSEN